VAGTAFVTGGSGFIGGHLIERLVRDGWSVRALARSPRSADRVAALGATAIPGDLDSPSTIRTGADGAELAFHAAAAVLEWGRRDDYVRANVLGTNNVLQGCRDAGVARLVHVSTEAVLMAGQPLVNVDETAPLRPDSPAYYPATKAMAEQLVRNANGNGFETVAVRPRLVWGPGDTTILPGLVAAIRGGRFAWIGGGRHLSATTHVANAVEGLILAAAKGRPGEAYFVTDGAPVVFRDFVTQLVASAGLEPPARSLPAALAGRMAAVTEGIWKAMRLSSTPPLSRMPVWLASQECTIDISKAQSELSYAPVMLREQGLAQLHSRGGQTGIG
jgi:nucleoside-diphosphate-sugar epimerase